MQLLLVLANQRLYVEEDPRIDLVDDMLPHANCGACGTACAGNEICEAGVCVGFCPEGFEDCGSQCADLQRDPANCGACGVTCGASEECSDGECSVVCRPGLFECDGRCLDLDSGTGNTCE